MDSEYKREPTRLAGTVSVVDDGVWVGGGSVGVPEAWDSSTELVLFGGDGRIRDRVTTDLPDGRWIADATAFVDDGRTYFAGVSCGPDRTGDAPGCPHPAPALLVAERGHAKPIDLVGLSLPGSPEDLIDVSSAGTYGGTIYLAAEAQHVGPAMIRTISVAVSRITPSTGVIEPIPAPPVDNTVGVCATGPELHAVGVDLSSGRTDEVALTHTTFSNAGGWSAPRSIQLEGTVPGGLFQVRCSAGDLVVLGTTATGWVLPLVVSGTDVESEPLDLPGFVSYTQRLGDRLLFTASTPTSGSSVTVWEFSAGEMREVASYIHSANSPPAAVTIQDGLYDIAPLASAPQLQEPAPLQKISR